MIKKQITTPVPSFQHWRTTLLGMLTSIGYALLSYYQDGQVSTKGALICAGFAALGYFSSDKQPGLEMQTKLDELAIAVRSAQNQSQQIEDQ